MNRGKFGAAARFSGIPKPPIGPCSLSEGQATHVREEMMQNIRPLFAQRTPGRRCPGLAQGRTLRDLRAASPLTEVHHRPRCEGKARRNVVGPPLHPLMTQRGHTIGETENLRHKRTSGRLIRGTARSGTHRVPIKATVIHCQLQVSCRFIARVAWTRHGASSRRKFYQGLERWPHSDGGSDNKEKNLSPEFAPHCSRTVVKFLPSLRVRCDEKERRLV